MHTHASLAATMLLATSPALPAAEGKAPEWTNVATADLHLMGDYEGEWLDAPKGNYYQINKPLAAQIVNVREGAYTVRFFQQHDARANAYFEGEARLDGETIRFDANGWAGTATRDGLTGTVRQGATVIRFALKRVDRPSPTLGAKPPAGALVLFDGKNFDHWQHADGRPATWWLLDDGAMEIRNARSEENRKNNIGGDIQTKQSFGDLRCHMEFRYPVEPGKDGQGRGNSGLFFQGGYEVQILNSYGLDGLWNECGALYKLAPPKVNAARRPLQWQSYDIEYRASVWRDGKKVSPPVISVWLNGVRVHNDEPIIHATAHAFATRGDEPQGPAPIRLQDHNNALQFRNIWIVPLDAK
jgi:hypothetical protein